MTMAAGSSLAAGLLDEGQCSQLGLTRHWEARLPLNSGETVREAFLVEDVLYVTSTSGAVFSVTADTGLIRWVVPLTEPGYAIQKPAHLLSANGMTMVAIVTSPAIYVLDRFTGAEIQRIPNSFGVSASTIGFGHALFLGGTDSLFRAMLVGGSPELGNVELWQVGTAGPVVTAPLFLRNRLIAFASKGGVVYSCDGTNKSLQWSKQLNGEIVADPAADEGGIYVACQDRSLYRLDQRRGNIFWRTRLPNPLTDAPVVSAHTVYQFCANHGLVALDADTGKMKWRNENGRQFVAHSQDRDVLFTSNFELQTVEHKTGKVWAAVTMDRDVSTVSNVQEGAVFVVKSDGVVVCARMENSPYLRLQQVTAARKKLNEAPGVADSAQEMIVEQAVEADGDSDPLRSRRDPRP